MPKQSPKHISQNSLLHKNKYKKPKTWNPFTPAKHIPKYHYINIIAQNKPIPLNYCYIPKYILLHYCSKINLFKPLHYIGITFQNTYFHYRKKGILQRSKALQELHKTVAIHFCKVFPPLQQNVAVNVLQSFICNVWVKNAAIFQFFAAIYIVEFKKHCNNPKFIYVWNF